MSGASGAAALVAGDLVVMADDGHLLHYARVGWLAAGATVLAIVLAWSLHRAKVIRP